MTLAWVCSGVLGELDRAAQDSPRKRQHLNLHRDYSDPAQRLLNHVCFDSYIRPHRHLESGREETLIALKGIFGILTFDDEGRIRETGQFASEHYAAANGCPLAVVVEPVVWHTVLALAPGSVLLECKGGPFDPNAAKELAPWAPEEGSEAASGYLHDLRMKLLGRGTV